jgi:tripartite-type tricarboxylate transporter receptor subunit TctC
MGLTRRSGGLAISTGYPPFLLLLLAHALALFGLAAPANAQDYPNRPVTMVVGFPPGGSTDATARIVQDPIAQALGQTIVIDNRSGAGGTTGAAAVANARPDGYTLLLSVNASLTMNMYLQKNFPFDPRTAFAPISLLSDVVLVLVVNAALPVKSVAELIAYAKQNPGKLSYGSSGVGSGHHICGELLKQKTGIDMVHVPYRGGAPTIQDLVAGNIQIAFGTLPSVLPHVATGAIRMIAAAERNRLPDYPDLPTINETIPGVFNIGWNGLLAPAGTPPAIVDKLNAVTATALKRPDVIAKMKLQGLNAMSDTPAEFAKLIKDEVAYWGEIIPAIGVKPE